MTFNFDGGDILVILLVIIILIVFRRLDRTGRSLEKVRRYAEKSKIELDSIVRERELSLKDLAVDLEVQEKTNREILSRADIAREEILSRAEELEDRVERIESHERALEELNDLALRVDENLSRLKDESAYVDDVGSRLSEIKTKIAGFSKKDAERFASFREEILGTFAAELEEMKQGAQETSRQLSLFHETLEGLNARRDEVVGERLERFRDELEKVEEDFHQRLQKVAQEGAKLEDDAFTELNARIDERSERLESNWLGGINELKNRVSSAASEIEEKLLESRTSQDLWESESSERFESFAAEFRKSEGRLEQTASEMEAARAELEKSISTLRDRIEQAAEKQETGLLESVEIKQAEYRKTIEARFSRLEGFIRDMDTVAESLKSSQRQVVSDVEATFTAFDVEMSERRDLEKSRIDEEASALQQEMADLERGLDELKSRAYDNVSEKLQVFEDDFFTDLKKRDEQMRSTLEDWQKDVDINLGDLGVKASREREETERRYSIEMKQKLTELQTRVFGQFESFQDQVDLFRENLSGRIRSAEDELATFQDELSDRVAREKESSAAEFVRSFEAFNKDAADKLAKANKTISQKLSDFAGEIETRKKEADEAIAATREDTADWRERLDAQLADGNRSVAEGVEALKADLAVQLSELRDEYGARTEQLIIDSGEERATLRKEISDLEESLIRISSEFTEKSRDALETLKEQGESFLLDFRKSSREARDEVERKIKELRQSVVEAREKAESTRKEMVSHTDSEYARIMRNLEEIDRRQRDFIAETRVFERADEMKEALEGDISALNAQLDEVGSGRSEIKAIREEYQKAISLHEDVSAKIARFLGEQQKVENLEGKIARISSLSEAVDLKLSRVGEAHDALQELQIHLKQLEDMHEDLSGRYERLSDKSSVLDTATAGIDKNFERMTHIESILKNVAEKLIPLRDDLNEAEERQSRLASDKKKVDAVVEKIAGLDNTIGVLDSRIAELGKAREWLARTETRLEEINNETQQKIRLLGTLSKREGSSARRSPGSPDMSTREMVVRLAREGWNSEEIARTTKLSRGEVELILELTPKE